jgi:hypothetical protein
LTADRDALGRDPGPWEAGETEEERLSRLPLRELLSHLERCLQDERRTGFQDPKLRRLLLRALAERRLGATHR